MSCIQSTTINVLFNEGSFSQQVSQLANTAKSIFAVAFKHSFILNLRSSVWCVLSVFFFVFFWMQCVGFELVFSDVCLQNSSRSKRAKFLISCGLFGQSKTILYFNALCNTYIAYVTFWWVFLWLFLSVLSLPAIVRVLYILLFLINIVVFVIIRVSVDFDKEFSKLLPRS